MRMLRDLSIRFKLAVLLTGILIVMSVPPVLIAYNDSQASQEQMESAYTTLAANLAARSRVTFSTLEWDGGSAAQTVLEGVSIDDHVLYAGLYDDSGSEVARYVHEGFKDAPIALPSAGVTFTENGYLDVMDVVGHQDQELGKIYLRVSTQELQARLADNVRVVVSVLIGAVVLSVLLFIVLNRFISAPILRLVEATTLVSAGHDYSVRVEKSSNDELGALCDSFNSMLGDIEQKETDLERSNCDLENYVKEVTSTLEQLRQREEQLEHTNRELDRTVQAIREAVGQLSTMGRQLSATVAEQSSGAQEQAASVSETTSTVNELAATSAEAADTATSTGEAARRTLEVGEQGRQAVAECIGAMQVVNEHVQITADNTLTLAERAHAIGEIIGTVKSIAEQTNILALNAAIEASRAGEHGRGFAVVASDVKQLADQSKKATAQIREILGQIQDATNKTVLSTEQGTKSVKEAQEVLTQAGGTIETLAEALEQSSVAATQIVSSARQQSQAVNQVTTAMQSIDKITQKAVTATRQVEQMATSLAALAGQLSEIVSQHEAVV